MSLYTFLDLYPPTKDFDVLGNSGPLAANTEYVVFDTTRVEVGGQVAQSLAAYSRRRSCAHLKRAWLTVTTDQALSFFHRHLSSLVVNPGDANWDNIGDGAGASPTAIAANTAGVVAKMFVHFFGDDHRLVLKTGNTPPTVLRLGLRLGVDQSLAE
jgi:hypothetical protein